MKRLRWPAWVVLALLFLFVLVGFNRILETVTYAQNEKVETKKLSNYPGLHLETRTSETKNYTLAISLPVSDDEQLNHAIQQWIDEQKLNFLME